jgi:hypothetical protein
VSIFPSLQSFCSWHNQEAYAIYDLNVWEALVAYRAKDERFAFLNSECNDCAGFLIVVRRFRKSYGLEDYSLKSIDNSCGAWEAGLLRNAERRGLRFLKPFQFSIAIGAFAKSLRPPRLQILTVRTP